MKTYMPDRLTLDNWTAASSARPRDLDGAAMTHWTDKLVKLHACDEAVKWARAYPSLKAAWLQCQHGDWMLWLAGKLAGPVGDPRRKKLVRAAVECSALALPYVQDEHLLAVLLTQHVSLEWSHGRASLDELCGVRTAAADAAYAAAAAAAYAAYVTYAAYAADAAADAAYAYAAAADAAAREETLATCADIVRKHYPKAPVLR